MDPKTRMKEYKRRRRLWGGKYSAMGEEPDKSQEWWKWTDNHDMWFLMGLPHYLRQYYCNVDKNGELICDEKEICQHGHVVKPKPKPTGPKFSPIMVTGPQTYVHPSVKHDPDWYGGTGSNQELEMIYAQVRNGRPASPVLRPNSAPVVSQGPARVTINGQPATNLGHVSYTSNNRPPSSYLPMGVPAFIIPQVAPANVNYSTPETYNPVTVSTQPPLSQTGHSAVVMNRSSPGPPAGLAGTTYMAIGSGTGQTPSSISQGPYIDVMPYSQNRDIEALYAKVQPRS